MTPDDHARLVKIAGLLSSDKDAERALAAAKASEILQRNGLTWEDALAAIPVTPFFASDLVEIEPQPGDELTRLRAELATSEAMRNALLAELEMARVAPLSV
ncbi:hypothetical protein [Aureimonas psammosilenae]|jgi:hypothetical protein|uniref:hypothetical protein n=1 Tax=Aureimonas psammosilenae TaxID=2495496 RepID=UPI001260DA1B|nr:hypothetical protein [Aureimonas psammosilenae]